MLIIGKTSGASRIYSTTTREICAKTGKLGLSLAITIRVAPCKPIARGLMAGRSKSIIRCYTRLFRASREGVRETWHVAISMKAWET